MDGFALFTKLPAELQDEVWALSMSDPQPEVCVTWPLMIDRLDPVGPSQPFMVDTAWPSVYHACRNAREAVKRSGALHLRHSDVAGFPVPCRKFNPAIDTLYWSSKQAGLMAALFLQKPKNADFARSLRHIAVLLSAVYPPSELAELIRQKAIFLQTLSVVLPDSSESYEQNQSFIPPRGRFKLRDIPERVVQGITLTNVPFLAWGENRTQGLAKFISSYLVSLDSHVQRFGILGEQGTAWVWSDESFSGVKMKAQSFVEYNGGEWVEVCRGRMLGEPNQTSRIRFILVADRRNPEVYRVLDDDCGRYPE